MTLRLGKSGEGGSQRLAGGKGGRGKKKGQRNLSRKNPRAITPIRVNRKRIANIKKRKKSHTKRKGGTSYLNIN